MANVGLFNKALRGNIVKFNIVVTPVPDGFCVFFVNFNFAVKELL